MDVGCGTGLIAVEAVKILGSAQSITCLDPSAGMLSVARHKLKARFVQGGAEDIPLPDESFDFLTMGYALRHVASLDQAFQEYHRVLARGGKVSLLEITKPLNRVGAAVMKVYFKGVYPWFARMFTGSEAAEDLLKYYWETIEACVRPELILEALNRAGFKQVKRDSRFGVLSEYSALNQRLGHLKRRAASFSGRYCENKLNVGPPNTATPMAFLAHHHCSMSWRFSTRVAVNELPARETG